jgi:hypothetical protein
MQYASTRPDVHASINVERQGALSQTIMGVAIIWFAVAAALGASGFLSAYARTLAPFVVAPVIVFIAAYTVSAGSVPGRWPSTLD